MGISIRLLMGPIINAFLSCTNRNKKDRWRSMLYITLFQELLSRTACENRIHLFCCSISPQNKAVFKRDNKSQFMKERMLLVQYKANKKKGSSLALLRQLPICFGQY